jgi:2,3-bisphosphoglycerate-independent phosphoglycerate mutase
MKEILPSEKKKKKKRKKEIDSINFLLLNRKTKAMVVEVFRKNYNYFRSNLGRNEKLLI